MPKTPIDFSKTIIYKIQKDDDFYVGSTTDFTKRKSQHKISSNNEKSPQYNLKVYQTIRDKGGWDTWEMTPLEEYVKCQNRIQQRIREDEWRVKLNASLNMRKAFRAETKQEYNNQYMKTYREKYSKEINEKRAVKYECECGIICSVGHKARHERSKDHQAYLTNL